jgi:hypothetical protein
VHGWKPHSDLIASLAARATTRSTKKNGWPRKHESTKTSRCRFFRFVFSMMSVGRSNGRMASSAIPMLEASRALAKGREAEGAGRIGYYRLAAR